MEWLSSSGDEQRSTELTRLYSSSPCQQLRLLDPPDRSSVSSNAERTEGRRMGGARGGARTFAGLGAARRLRSASRRRRRRRCRVGHRPEAARGRDRPTCSDAAGRHPPRQRARVLGPVTQSATLPAVAIRASVDLPRRRAVLAVLLAAPFLAVLDAFIVLIALPSIQDQLHATDAGVLLVVAGYVVAYAAFLITGGRLGDAYGRRKLLVAGLFMFSSTSLLGAAAP